jgi:hypothetical protein
MSVNIVRENLSLHVILNSDIIGGGGFTSNFSSAVSVLHKDGDRLKKMGL